MSPNSTAQKRKLDSKNHEPNKRIKLTTPSDPSCAVKVTTSTSVVNELPTTNLDKDKLDTSESLTTTDSKSTTTRRRINKLVPHRPHPTVPTSVSATGPRSAHKEGKNVIYVTRKTNLGAYMRRCKDVIFKDGYKTLHLNAMGAAIPRLLHLVAALPPILPFPRDEIHLEVTTGTVEVHDEIIPEDEDEDITYQTRSKSSLTVVVKIGNGEFEGDRSGVLKKNGRRGRNNGNLAKKTVETKGKAKVVQSTTEDLVFEEPEQEDMEML